MKKNRILSALMALLVSVPMTLCVLANNFDDTVGHWGEAYIEKAVGAGLFLGNGNGKFNPDGAVTRGQFVTVLWRMADSPAVDAKTPFSDIENQHADFKAAIAWAYENGYIQGTGDTTFDPDGILTREAAMRILFNYSSGQIGSEILFTAVYDGLFFDSAEISDWAKAGMYWGVYNEIIAGVGNNMLNPRGTMTRAQLAKIMTVYNEINNK